MQIFVFLICEIPCFEHSDLAQMLEIVRLLVGQIYEPAIVDAFLPSRSDGTSARIKGNL
jgi:response regulator RpfG family c-di-GMP phosphodiesterase